MKQNLRIIIVLLVIIISKPDSYGQDAHSQGPLSEVDKIQALRDTLNALSERTDSELFKIHCESILTMISSNDLGFLENSYIEDIYDAFINVTDPYCPANLDTYLQRRRPFILTWTSPSDGSASLAWMKPPRNWNPGQSYPLYVELHGLWSVASNFYQYMAYPFSGGASFNNAFEDGFLISPWGRGNYWYQGSSEIDIWESIATIENIVSIDSSRKYLCGHSMGGYGTMYIAARSPGVWAAIGIHAGALEYYPSPVSTAVANILKDVPVYFICGTQDYLLTVNQDAYRLLQNAGNKNLYFNTFNGGHEYRESDVYNMYMWMRRFVNNDFYTHAGNIDDDTHHQKIVITTNPAISDLTVFFDAYPNEKTQIRIYDLSGRRICYFEDNSGEESITFSVSDLIPGLYVLQVNVDGVYTESKLFVKQ